MINKLTLKDKKILNSIVEGGWVQNSKTGLIDVKGDVDIHNTNLIKIPVKFGVVTEDFHCYYNQLINLEGSPIEVGDNFYCDDNQLQSLEGGPKYIGKNFGCNNNKLMSLKECPKTVNLKFSCSGNQLQSTKYLPLMITNYDNCIREINRQKTEYLISMGFDPDDRKLFKQLLDKLDK